MIEDWSVPKTLSRQVSKDGDRPFLAMAGEPVLSVGEIARRSRRVANGLRELGVGFGDRVLVMLPNCVEFIEAWLAINSLGAVIVPVNTGYKGSFLEHVANNAAAKLVVVDAGFLAGVLASKPRLVALETVVLVGQSEPDEAPGLTIIPFGTLRDAADKPVDVEVKGSDLAAIVYTSGTTGTSKGVLIPHAHLYLNPHVYLDQLGVRADDIFYSCLPLFHTNALGLQVYGALIAGCTVHVAPRFSASAWLSDIRRAGATVTNLLGVMADFVLRQPPSEHDIDNALRIATAVPMTAGLRRSFEGRFGVKLINLYGSTEANCPIYQPRDEVIPEGSCGRVVQDWYECRIANPQNDEELPDGEVGELLIRPLAPNGFMAGYNGQPEETVAAWRNLWFHTGDALRRDADGYFYFIDRIKDSIRRRGENISSHEVESVVLEHPSVAEVAAVGIRSPFDDHEQEVKICVVLKPGETVEAETIHNHCIARMPDFAVPRFIEFFSALPKTPTEKIQKRELRDGGVSATTWVAPNAAGRSSPRAST